MKKLSVKVVTTLAAIAVILLVFPSSAPAEDGSETVYKAKCASCHGPDGSGSAMGKKLGAHDFHSPDVPTVAETVSDFQATGWAVLVAPIGTPE
jgi:mono/diheme cytochrome c family protein